MHVQKYVRYERIREDDLPFVENDAYARVLCPRWYFEFPCSLFRRGPAYTSQDLLAEDWLRYHGFSVISLTPEASPILKIQTDMLYASTIYVDRRHKMWRINFWKGSRYKVEKIQGIAYGQNTIVDVSVKEIACFAISAGISSRSLDGTETCESRYPTKSILSNA